MVSCSGLLVPSCCGEGRELQTSVTGLCGEHSRFSGHTGFAPARGGCVCFPCLHCSGSWLLSREQSLHCVDFPGLSRSDSGFWVFHKSTDLVGPAFCVFPGQSSSSSQELDERTLPGCRAPYPLRGPSLISQAGRVCLVSVLGSWTLAATLPVDVDHPESQGSLWLEAGSLFAVW